MQRLLTLSAALVLSAAALTPAAAGPATAVPAIEPSATDFGGVKTTSYRCCWIYIAGNWYCIPCGR